MFKLFLFSLVWLMPITILADVKINILYLRPDETLIDGKPKHNVSLALPPIEDQKLWVRKALLLMPVNFKITKEVMGLDECTKDKHLNFYNVLFCYKRIAKKYNMRTKPDVVTMVVAQPFPLGDGRLYYRGYANSICGIRSLPYGFAYTSMTAGDESRAIAWFRHELLHLLGCSHDSKDDNIMSQRLFVIGVNNPDLKLNLKARKQIKFCFRRMKVKYKESGY